MTVEEAIKRLEFMAINITGSLANACQPDIFSQLLSDSIDAIDMAQEALREQAERQSGCEYCKDSEDLAYGHDSMQRTGRIYLDGNLLTADLYSESMAAAICFCPMCGKRLEVEHDGR